MLRINLLPDYIGDKNKIRNVGIWWGIIVVAIIFVMLYFNGRASSALAEAQQDRQTKEGLKSQTDGIKAQIASEKQARAVVESKQTFVKGAQSYNTGWAEVFETIRDVRPTDSSIVLDSMTIDSGAHKTVSLVGFGTSETAIVRWWMQLRDNTALFEHVNFDLVPHSYAPVVTQASTGGMGGMMGPGGPMSGGQMMGLTPGAGGPMTGGMGAPMMGGGKFGSMGVGGAGGGQGSTSVGPGELQGRKGINFTAQIVLKAPMAGGIPAPSWPAGGGTGGGGGGFSPGMAGPMGMTGPGSGGPSSGGPGK